jgi:hypothetical protein
MARRIDTTANLALIDDEPGTEYWVESEGCFWQAVPRTSRASNAVDGPVDVSTPISWQPKGVSVLTPGGTVAASSIAGIDSVTGGVANGLPPYVYGRDAAMMLPRLLEPTCGIALFIFGDSKSVNTPLYASSVWTALNITGIPIGVGAAAEVAYWTTYLDPYVAGSRVASRGFAGEYVNDHMLATGENSAVCSNAVTYSPAHWAENRLQYGGITLADRPLMFARWSGHDWTANWIIRTAPNGVTANNIYAQARLNRQLTGESYQKSAAFATAATPAAVIRKSLTVSSALDIVTGPPTYGFAPGISLELQYGGIATVPGEVVSVSLEPWIELAADNGIVMHSVGSIGGSAVQDFLCNSYGVGSRASNQYVDTVLASELPLRAGRNEPWLLISVGPNNPGTDTQQQYEAQLTRLIEQMRYLARAPNMCVILSTSTPASGNEATWFYQLGMRAVANRMRNVTCVDVYAAARDGGGYPTAVTNGWMADTIHRNDPGRRAEMRLVETIWRGVTPIPYSTTLG